MGTGYVAESDGKARQAKDRSMEDAIFSPRERRPGRSMAARQDATHREDTSVQGLVAADRWEVQNDQANENAPRLEDAGQVAAFTKGASQYRSARRIWLPECNTAA
jgi:hypothetical protein